MGDSDQPSYKALLAELEEHKHRLNRAEARAAVLALSAQYMIGDLMSIIGRLPEGEVSDELEAAIYRYHKRTE